MLAPLSRPFALRVETVERRGFELVLPPLSRPFALRFDVESRPSEKWDSMMRRELKGGLSKHSFDRLLSRLSLNRSFALRGWGRKGGSSHSSL